MFIAHRVGLLDKPDHRKKHQSPTPLVGGICIYLALVLSIFFVTDNGISTSLLGWLGVVLVIGVLDDFFDVSFRIRMGCHALIVIGIWMTDGLVVTNIGAITGGGVDWVFTGIIALGFTVIAVVGAINSTNMSDGVDGLLASLCLVSMVVLCACAHLEGMSTDSITVAGMSVMIGAVVAFFITNTRFFGAPRASVFLGDAGSTFLGFVLVYMLIAYTQGAGAMFSPVVAGWVLGLPLIDASAVIATRLLERRAPFYPDRRHLHHLLLDSGLSVNRTVAYLLSAHIAVVMVGVIVHSVAGRASDPYLFWAFVGLVVVRIVVGTIYTSEPAAKVTQANSRDRRSSDSYGGEETLSTSVAAGIGLADSAEPVSREVGTSNLSDTGRTEIA